MRDYANSVAQAARAKAQPVAICGFEMSLDNLEDVLAAADMTLANVVRLNVYTTDFDELVKHWTSLSGRFGKSDSRFATTLLGVTRLFTPQLLVLLEATAVD
jgi:enamine deaminase RidA (YjgF/YER057c/UK114 family)